MQWFLDKASSLLLKDLTPLSEGMLHGWQFKAQLKMWPMANGTWAGADGKTWKRSEHILPSFAFSMSFAMLEPYTSMNIKKYINQSIKGVHIAPRNMSH